MAIIWFFIRNFTRYFALLRQNQLGQVLPATPTRAENKNKNNINAL